MTLEFSLEGHIHKSVVTTHITISRIYYLVIESMQPKRGKIAAYALSQNINATLN